MPTAEYFLEHIERELTGARVAHQDGNEGRARVCARRAAGAAIAWFLSKNPREGWGNDALGQLVHLKDDAAFPGDVRDAATRLTTKISDRFSYPFATRPIDDALIIVHYVREVME